MVLFKINGERNSGTNFLTNILKINGFPTYVHTIKPGRVVYEWKHGVPSNTYKELDEKVVDLFIFRNLDDWLVSMFKNPYELKRLWNNDFNSFLHTKHLSCNYWRNGNNNNRSLNEDDNNKTIFQIREYKFDKIMEYNKNNKDVVLLNLSFIQNEENLAQFLDFLSENYIPEFKDKKYILSLKHTKNSSNNKNRTYDINVDEYRDIIDLNKNVEIEDFINSLTFISNSDI